MPQTRDLFPDPDPVFSLTWLLPGLWGVNFQASLGLIIGPG